MNEKSIINYEKMASFNVMFFDIHCNNFELIPSIFEEKHQTKFEQDIDGSKYKIEKYENISQESNQFIILLIKKYTKKPNNVGVYDNDLKSLDDAEILSNSNLVLINIQQRVCLLHKSKTGVNMSAFTSIINSNNKKVDVNFTVVVNDKKINDFKNITKLTISQRGETSLFSPLNERLIQRWQNIELGTIKIEINAKRCGSLPKNKIIEESKDISIDYNSFNIQHNEGLYDFVKHKLTYSENINDCNEISYEIYRDAIIRAYNANRNKI